MHSEPAPEREAARPGAGGGKAPALALLAVVAAAAAPRVLGAFDGLWLDEIWSLRLAEEAGSPVRVFTALHHDNNHYLTTLWLLLLGPGAPPPLLRLPALVAGIAAVWLAGRAGSAREGVLAALLVGLSYPFVHYASEARGYALVVPLALGAWLLLGRHLEDRRVSSGLAFGGVAALGFLAHLTFLGVWAALLAWSAVRLLRSAPRPLAALRRLALLHALPAGLLAALFAVDLRWLRLGGGPELPLARGVLDAWAYALGLPAAGPVAWAGAAAFLLPLAVELESLRRSRDDAWIFFLAVLLAPAGILVAFAAHYAPPRYFLASLAFGLILIARGLLRLGRAPRPWPWVAAVLVTAFVAGNAWRVGRFLADGRGAYREAVSWLAAETRGDMIRVASDHDFRNRMVLEHYARTLPRGRRLEYVTREAARERPPEWRLEHALGDAFEPDPIRDLPGPARYGLRAVFPKYGLSGWHWAVYRLREPQGSASQPEGSAGEPVRGPDDAGASPTPPPPR